MYNNRTRRSIGEVTVVIGAVATGMPTHVIEMYISIQIPMVLLVEIME